MIELAAGALAQSSGVEGAIVGPAGIPVAFAVGLVSSFSPCVLPLLPGYLSYMSGVSGEDLRAGAGKRRVLGATLLFVLGFALVFTALGATASAVGTFLVRNLRTLNYFAGGLVVLMGLVFLSGLAVRRFQRWVERGGLAAAVGRIGLRVASLFQREWRPGGQPRSGIGGALPLGAAFAVGWTPCVGPGLATILTLSATEGSVVRGSALLFAFSLGLGIPFVLGGLAFRKALGASRWLRRHNAILMGIGGMLLLAIGVLLVTNQWEQILAPLRRSIVRFTPPI